MKRRCLSVERLGARRDDDRGRAGELGEELAGLAHHVLARRDAPRSARGFGDVLVGDSSRTCISASMKRRKARSVGTRPALVCGCCR